MKFRLEFGVVLAVCILGLLPNLAFAASPSCPALSANLAQGSTGPEVTALQEYLAEYPTVYPQGIISAYYGSLTTAAVERFQALHGIVSSGSPYTTGYGALGPRTRAAIESSCGTPPPPPPQNSCPTFIEPLGPGSTGEGVSTLQSFLGRFPALYPEDLTSGYYGSLTTAAVERFQTLENVVSSGSPYTTGYGAVGPRTAAALATYCAETTVSTSTPEGNNTSGSGGGGGGGGTQGGGQEDTIPPSVPQNLQASPTEGQVFLSWSPSTDNVGVQGYYVYRDGAEIANVGGTVYTDTNVTDGDTYTYTVAAYDYSGNVSGLSSPVNATVPSGGGGGQAPSAPANLTASSTVDTVSLSWDASTGGEGGVAGYQIYRNDTEVGSATTTSYTDTAVTPNTAYEYYVTAYDEDGDVSSPSNTEDIQTAADSEPPTTPQDLTVTGTTVSTASLSWQASTDPLGIPIGGYTVYRDGTAVASTTSTTYTDSGLAPSTTYTYTVSAYDEFDTASPQSPPAYATTQANGPSAPTNLASSNITSSSLTLSWSASTETDGTIAGYDVYRNEVKIATVTSTFYNDSGLSPGTMYEYTVDAFDTSGNYSPQSSPLYVTTLQSQGTGPTVPQGLEVTGTTTSSISLAWDASTDEDGTIEGYNVFRNGTAIATTSQTEYTDTGLSEGTTYSYTVDAYDNNGYYSAQSGAVQGTTGGGQVNGAHAMLGAWIKDDLWIPSLQFGGNDTEFPELNSLIENITGHNLGFNLFYAGWDELFESTTTIEDELAEGITPVITWGIQDSEGNCVSAYDIVNGDENSTLASSAQQAQTFNGTIMVRWDWEMTDSQDAQCLYTNSLTDPTANPDLVKTDPELAGQEYVAAWQYIYNYFKNAGVTNVEWVWAPSADLFSNGDKWQYFYPGNDYVDWVANDNYNKSADSTSYESDPDIADFYGTAAPLGKPLMQSETAAIGPNPQYAQASSGDYYGCNYTVPAGTSPEAEWISSAQAAIDTATEYPAFKAFNYWSSLSGSSEGKNIGDLGTSTNSCHNYALHGDGLTAFETMASDPYFQASGPSQFLNNNGVYQADNQPATTPTNVQVANVTDTTVSLSWKASTDNDPVIGYDIYQNGIAIGTSTAPSFTATGLTEGTTYSYTIDAYDAEMNRSSLSSPVQGTTSGNSCGGEQPQIPQFTLNLTLGSTGPEVTALQKLLGVTQSGYYGALTEVAVEKFQSAHGIVYSGSPLTTGYGQVGAKTRTALNQQGGLHTPDDTCGPTVPQGLAVTATTTSSISLAWDASTDQNGTIEGYNVFRNGTAIATTSQTEYTDTGLASGTTYSYTVDAYDSNGEYSAQSGAVEGETGGGGGNTLAPNGVYLALTTDENIASNTADSNSLDNGGVEGVFIKDLWSNVQPTQNTWNWSYLDSQIQQVEAAGKKVSLGVKGGENSPAWVLSSVLTIPSIDDQVTDATFCEPMPSPAPWDATYEADWTTFIETMAAHQEPFPHANGQYYTYANDPDIVLIKISGIDSFSDETRLANNEASVYETGTKNGQTCLVPNDVQNWITIGYTSTKVFDAFQDFATTFANAFPDKMLGIMGSATGVPDSSLPSIDQNGNYDPTEHSSELVTTEFMPWASATFGNNRVIFAQNALRPDHIDQSVLNAAQACVDANGWQQAALSDKCYNNQHKLVTCSEDQVIDQMVWNGLGNGSYSNDATTTPGPVYLELFSNILGSSTLDSLISSAKTLIDATPVPAYQSIPAACSYSNLMQEFENGDTSPPSIPSGLEGAASTTDENGTVYPDIDLSWTASTDNVGVTGYQIYRNSAWLATIPAPNNANAPVAYSDISVQPDTTYTYTVTASDDAGNVSGQSSSIQVTSSGNSCGDGQYQGTEFTENLTVGSTGSEVTALQKLLGVTQSGYYGALTEAAVEKFQASHNIVYSGSPLTTGYGALGPKTREALNESGPQTGSGGGSTCGPTVPQGLEVTGTTTSSISLAWQASTDNEGSITGYNVFRNGTAIATTTTTAYTDTGLSEGTSYSYTVDAYDNLGNYSAQSGAVEGTTGGGGDGGTVLIGLHGSQSDIDAIEKDMGRPPAIQYAYYSISSNFSTSSSPAVQEIANGSIPMINWIPHEAGNTNSKDYCGGVTATNILSGMFDGPNINPYTGNQNPGFYAQAEEIKSLGVPVIVGWFGQMTDSIPDTCFYTTNVGDVSVAGPEYVAAYRHIVSIFKDVGATNVQFVWPPAATLMSKGSNTCDLNGQKNLPDWECFYPGNAWVDWIGNDHYNKSSSVSDYDQDSDIINWYNAVAPLGKPLMQRQTGAIATSTETPDPQSEWVTTAHTSINPSLASSTENTFPAIKVFSYNDSNSQANGQILQNLGSNKGLTDFIDLADDPYFGATSVNQYFSSTGGDPDNIGTPSNLNVTGETNSSISISWSPSTDEYPINGYDIFRDGEIIGEATTSTSYTDTGLSEGTTYSYTVEAYDENGYYSAQSSAVQQGTLGGNQCGGNNDNQGGSLFTQNLGLGSTGVQVTALQKLLGVTQSGYYGALTEAAVEKFQASHNIVYSGSPLTTGYGALGPKTREALNESGPQTGSGGGSTCGPTVPQGLEVTGTTTSSISLAWQASTDNEGSITGYNVFRNGTAIATTTTTAYTDTGLSEGTSYSYTVDAYDNNGYYSAQSGAIYGTTGVEEGGTPTVLIGAHVDLSSVPETQRRSDFITLGNEIGRPLAIDSEYADFYNLASSTITSRIAWDEQNGLIPMLSWRNEFYDGNKGEQAGNCADAADIASGAYDSALIQEADAIKALGEPVLIRWRYEFDDYASMPCFYNFDSKLTDAEEGAEYVASFEHIFNIFQEQGATNVQWIWAPTSTLFSENGENDDIDWQYFYPTNNYVDWIAVDNYNHDDTLKAFYDDGSGLPYDSDIADFYNDVEGSTTNVKPLMLSETAACNDPAQYPTDPQTEWIETIESGMEKAFPAFHAFIWWDTQGNGGNCDQGDNGNYDGNAYWLGTEPLGGSTPGLAAYTTLAQDPYFQLPTSDISNFFSSGNNSGKANSPVSPSAGSCPLLSTTLTLGAKNATTGGQVSVLQRILSKVFPTASVTGYFGTLTESLVKEFQASHGIISYGSPLTTGYGAVGPKTRTALEAACLLTQSTASSTVLTLLTNTTTTATTTVSTTTTTTKTDTTPPSIPQGLIASVISSGTPGVRLSWSPATDNVAVAGYYIYRSGSLLTSATTTSYIDTTMRSDSTYVYTVRAYDAAGNVSAASNGVSITAPYIPDTTPPSAPSNLTASVELKGGSGPGVGTNYAIVLSWSPATDNVGVAGYDIYRATGNTFATLTLLTSVSSLTYTDASVSPGTTYYYTVKAYDAAGNISGASNEASGSF